PAASGEEDLARVVDYELNNTTKLFERYFEAGKPYYFSSYRKEAIYFFNKCLELRPGHGGLTRFVALLQDYDNPVWKKKQWRSPKARVDGAFRRKVEALTERYIAVSVELGSYAARFKGKELRERARGHFVKALEMHGGPYEVDERGRILLGEKTKIPQDSSAWLLADELIRINGLLYLRDSMLRTVPEVDVVRETRGAHVLIRTIGNPEQADALVPLMEAAWEQLVLFTGQEPEQSLGLFLFPDADAYRKYCDGSGHGVRRMAAGFANAAEGFAVTFEQSSLEMIAIHESAHLFHYFAFRSSMPSWYDEGFATTFGGQDTYQWEGGRLEVDLPMARHRIGQLLDPAENLLPLAELLTGDATVYTNRMDGSAERFYAQSWAFYRFLRTTRERRLQQRFAEWEGFCLGAGYAREKQGHDAGALFGRLFGDVMSVLEEEFKAWLRELV
ncbi:MAG: hypothetical protein V2A76_16285, partial [Planctomycetota bacterium]